MGEYSKVDIGDRPVGSGEPCFVVGEIGINHNGDLGIAKQLIDVAVAAGCDAVKFQKRTPELCVPDEQKQLSRETPWGVMTYLEYRHRVEFGPAEYDEIDRYVRERGIRWTASPWDLRSVDFLAEYELPFVKVSSPHLTNDTLLHAVRKLGVPVVLSTGMSTMDEIRHAVSVLGQEDLVVLHCTSTYPAAPEEINLRAMDALREEFSCPVGYSGHEVGLQVTLAAVALGAVMVERHITLDRAMWGSDHAASVEPWGLMRLVRDIRVIEAAMGDGEKRVYESELPLREKLRGA